MALTDVAIRNAKPGAKATKLADGGGMFLLITPAGGKLWRLKYRVDGREKLLAIGTGVNAGYVVGAGSRAPQEYELGYTHIAPTVEASGAPGRR